MSTGKFSEQNAYKQNLTEFPKTTDVQEPHSNKLSSHRSIINNIESKKLNKNVSIKATLRCK